MERTGAKAGFAEGERKLKELNRSLDLSSDIEMVAMRKLMRDPAIRRSLQKTGKLPAGS